MTGRLVSLPLVLLLLRLIVTPLPPSILTSSPPASLTSECDAAAGALEEESEDTKEGMVEGRTLGGEGEEDIAEAGNEEEREERRDEGEGPLEDGGGGGGGGEEVQFRKEARPVVRL